MGLAVPLLPRDLSRQDSGLPLGLPMARTLLWGVGGTSVLSGVHTCKEMLQENL